MKGKKIKDLTPVRKENGRYQLPYVKEVLEYAKEHSNAAAMRHFEVAHSTFYTWLRNSRPKKRRR